jgi:hypothetical protein
MGAGRTECVVREGTVVVYRGERIWVDADAAADGVERTRVAICEVTAVGRVQWLVRSGESEQGGKGGYVELRVLSNAVLFPCSECGEEDVARRGELVAKVMREARFGWDGRKKFILRRRQWKEGVAAAAEVMSRGFEIGCFTEVDHCKCSVGGAVCGGCLSASMNTSVVRVVRNGNGAKAT